MIWKKPQKKLDKLFQTTRYKPPAKIRVSKTIPSHSGTCCGYSVRGQMAILKQAYRVKYQCSCNCKPSSVKPVKNNWTIFGHSGTDSGYSERGQTVTLGDVET